MDIDFNKVNLNKVRDEVNWILFNSKYGNMENMKFTNKLIEELKNVQFKVNNT